MPDWRIGRCSEWAQRWVDRNFALDIAAFPPTADDDQAAGLEVRLRQMADAEFLRLHQALTGPCGRLQAALGGEHAALLGREFDRWAQSPPTAGG